jgi:hypothetical protein
LLNEVLTYDSSKRELNEYIQGLWEKTANAVF